MTSALQLEGCSQAPQIPAWNSPLIFLALTGQTHLSAASSCAAWMLPLMCFFVCFFPLLKGELAQTSLGVLTGFNEQLLSRARTSTNQTVLCTGVEGVAGYPSVLRLWLLISSSLCSTSAQKSNYFDF